MRVCADAAQLAESLVGAQRQAGAAFGDEQVFQLADAREGFASDQFSRRVNRLLPLRVAPRPQGVEVLEDGVPQDVANFNVSQAPITAVLLVEFASTNYYFMRDALQAADVREKLEALGADPVGNTPEEFSAMVKVEVVLALPVGWKITVAVGPLIACGVRMAACLRDGFGSVAVPALAPGNASRQCSIALTTSPVMCNAPSNSRS